MDINALPVEGGYIHYSVDGPAHLPFIVFCNSLGTDARIWSAITQVLGSQYRFLLYDKRGHGLSTSGGGNSIDEHTDDLIQLLETLNFSQVYLCGLSIGGMIALNLSSKRPDLVKALILCDTAHMIGTFEMWDERIDTIQSKGIPTVAEAVLDRWFTPLYREREPARFALWRNMLLNTQLEGYVNSCIAIRNADLTDACLRISVPTICLVGDDDKATSPDLVRSMADLIPAAHFATIEHAGHLPCIEQPEAMAELMVRFLTSYDDDLCRYDRGINVRRSVLGSQHVDRAGADQTTFDEPFQTFITEAAWGSVWSRPGLSKRDRSLLTIVMMAVLGHDDELAMHIRATANTGASMEEVRETLLQVAVYAGAPASNNAVRIAKTIYAEMERFD